MYIHKLAIIIISREKIDKFKDVDIYVYTINEGKIVGLSRKELGRQSRKCFICDLDANICSRSQKHSIEDIKQYFDKKYKDYLRYLNEREIIPSKLAKV